MYENWTKNLLKLYRENKLAHVFLLETNNIERCYSDLLNLLIDICNENIYLEENNIKKLILSNELPSLITIKSEKNDIKKEQIIELKEKFKYKPLYTEYNMYVILNAERLNASSANTMLKFIEEPTSNTLGFLITNNKESIINTIKSRCQIIKANYENIEEEENNEFNELIKNYIKILENKNSILFYRDVLNNFIKDRVYIKKILEDILNIYISIYKDKVKKYDKIIVNNKEKLLKKINITKNYVEKMNFNVNIELLLDSYALEMEKANE